MPRLHVVFSHGQESGPWGTKITAMAEVAKKARASVDSIDYRGISDPTERVEKLVQSQQGSEAKLLLVGSSMGGHVACAAALKLRPVGVFVLAPAFYMPGYEKLTPLAPSCPLAIVHGWSDDVVPPEHSLRYGRESHCELHMVRGDHRLTDNLEMINFLFLNFIQRVRALK